MTDQAQVIHSTPFCADDDRFSGAAEVVYIPIKNTIGMRLRVGKRFVHIPRHRVSEIIAALSESGKQASKSYKKIIEEMNP